MSTTTKAETPNQRLEQLCAQEDIPFARLRWQASADGPPEYLTGEEDDSLDWEYEIDGMTGYRLHSCDLRDAEWVAHKCAKWIEGNQGRWRMHTEQGTGFFVIFQDIQ